MSAPGAHSSKYGIYKNYSKVSESLWQFCKDETDFNNTNLADFND